MTTSEHSDLCNRCAGQYTDGFACGLMVEAENAEVPVVSCAHFGKKGGSTP